MTYCNAVLLDTLYSSPADEKGIYCCRSIALLCMVDPKLHNEIVRCAESFADDDDYSGTIDVKKTVQTSIGTVQIWRENAGYVITWA